MSLLGERITTRLLTVPSGPYWLTNGDAIDAGTAHILDSNISHMVREGVRHLVAAHGPGVIGTKGTTSWNGIVDAGRPPSGFTLQTHNEIPWDRDTARRHGPFVIVADRDLSGGGGVSLRSVKCEMQVTLIAGITSFDAYFALTTSPSPVALTDGGYLAVAKQNVTSAGTHNLGTTLSATARVTGAEPLPCRASAARGTQTVRAVLCWVWFGWRATGGTGHTIDARSAWETR